MKYLLFFLLAASLLCPVGHACDPQPDPPILPPGESEATLPPLDLPVVPAPPLSDDASE